ncbi:MAG: calcium-binding protein [Planctomycetes bacterium]|nr:calcium-binding protein [Planctomycetota bacterium]
MSLLPIANQRRSWLCFVLLAGSAAAQTTSRASVATGGLESNGDSTIPAVSADGRFVSFGSLGSNLVAGDTNATWDTFVRDRFTGVTTRVSVSSAGVEQSSSSDSSISGDGRWVAFDSAATALVAGDTNGKLDAFVHDRQTGTTTRVSVSSGGLQANGASQYPRLSDDGRWIAFSSGATNLVAGDVNGDQDVFLHDTLTGATVLVSVDSGGSQGNGGSMATSVSGDGRYVAFYSSASNLVAGDTNAETDIFVRDLVAGQTVCASRNLLGLASDGSSSGARLSADGRIVAFSSTATDLVLGDTNHLVDTFVYDLVTGTTTRVSVSSSGMQASEDFFSSLGSLAGGVSADGRWIVFASDAVDLVVGDTNHLWDVFLHDRQTGTTSRANLLPDGSPTIGGDSTDIAISSDGRTLVYESRANALVPFDANGAVDIFVRDENQPMPVVYCTAKTNSLGCTPSIALLGATSASAGSGAQLKTTQVLGAKNGLYFHSTLTPVALPFHGGWLCVKAPTKRHAPKNSGGTAGTCNGVSSEDFNAYIASGADPALVAGATVSVQHWSRDPAAPFGDGLSNAVRATIAP